MKHENLPTNVKILLEARRLIKQGWVKGVAQAGDSVCLMQALWIASRENQGDCVAAAETVRRVIGGAQIPSWNDCAWRTLDGVLGALDEAIMREMGARGLYKPIEDHFFIELEKIGG